MELQVMYDDQTVKCALILLVLINFLFWNFYGHSRSGQLKDVYTQSDHAIV